MKVSRNIEGCFEGVLRVLQGSFKGVPWNSQRRGNFKDVSWFSGVFPECFEGVSRMFQENLQGVSKKLSFRYPIDIVQFPSMKCLVSKYILV